MRRIPNFVLLRAFEAAARLQSFALAAHELHLTPSAISHQVRELEELFGKPLFKRSHRRVELLPEGARLSDRLGRILDALEACCADVSLAASDQVLSVYCAPSLAVKWLGPRLASFTKEHPDITIRLSTGAEPLDLTIAQAIDVSISYARAIEKPGLDVVALGEESIVPLCAPSLKTRGKTWRQLVCELPLIDSELSRVTWRDWFALNGLALPAKPRASFDRGALAISAAVDGMGLVLETIRFAERELARGDLVEAGTSDFQRIRRETHFFSQRANEREIPKVRAFRAWLFAQIVERTSGGRRPQALGHKPGGERPTTR